MAKSQEVSEERHPDEESLEDVPTEKELAARVEATRYKALFEGLESARREAEEHYKTQIAELQAQITGLRYERGLREQRIQTLKARERGWRPWRRAKL
jgi:hypothetical protein